MTPEGVWQSRGYGWVLHARAGGFDVYDVTSVSGTKIDEGDSFERAFSDVIIESPSVMRLKHRGDLTAYWFDRLAALPQHCSAGEFPSPDAIRNFDVLWRQFRENYAFFPLRNVDWEESYRAFRPLVYHDTDADRLWETFGKLLAPLRDTHVSISDGARTLDVTSPIRDRKIKVIDAFGAPPWSKNRIVYTQTIQRVFGEMFLAGQFRTTSNDMMIYGEVDPGIGYVSMFGEFGHAATARARAALDLPRPRLEASSFLADEIAALRESLDEVATAFVGARGLVVDVRLNYGGYDRLALDFAGLFTDRSRVAYRKKVWTGNGFTSSQAIEIQPRALSLAHLPVCLLTSRQTASAGEILVLGMTSCPNVTRIGEVTLGILSDNLYKKLPIGWEVSLSNEVYEAADGALYESVGIPPQIETPVFDPGDVRGGFRHAVDKAVEVLRAKLGQ